MRELKFRIWSKVAQCMVSWDDVELKPHMIFDKSNYIPILFTGLKDRNGKDIYDGDILEIKLGIICKVEYSAKYAEYMFVDKDDMRWGMDEQYDRKIIGNIYDSPNLLSEI